MDYYELKKNSAGAVDRENGPIDRDRCRPVVGGVDAVLL
jgi:hypothetical protein